jgi:hypothetical protein
MTKVAKMAVFRIDESILKNLPFWQILGKGNMNYVRQNLEIFTDSLPTICLVQILEWQ